jgi:hypothetical protein
MGMVRYSGNICRFSIKMIMEGPGKLVYIEQLRLISAELKESAEEKK